MMAVFTICDNLPDVMVPWWTVPVRWWMTSLAWVALTGVGTIGVLLLSATINYMVHTICDGVRTLSR